MSYPGNDGARIQSQSFGIREHSVDLILRLGFESDPLQVPLPGAESNRLHKLKTFWRSGMQMRDVS